jgi:predicted CopG family antitoxin
MSTKTITITEDAYRRLRQSKHGEESFSQIITRLTGNAQFLMKFFGVLSEESSSRIEQAMKNNRKRWEHEEKKKRGEIRRTFSGMS